MDDLRLFRFRGRLGRRKFLITYAMVTLLVSVLAYWLVPVDPTSTSITVAGAAKSPILGWVWGSVVPAALGLGYLVRRLHDMNISGWVGTGAIFCALVASYPSVMEAAIAAPASGNLTIGTIWLGLAAIFLGVMSVAFLAPPRPGRRIRNRYGVRNGVLEETDPSREDDARNRRGVFAQPGLGVPAVVGLVVIFVGEYLIAPHGSNLILVGIGGAFIGWAAWWDRIARRPSAERAELRGEGL